MSTIKYVCPHCGSDLQGDALMTVTVSMEVGVVDFQTNCSSCGKIISKKDIDPALKKSVKQPNKTPMDNPKKSKSIFAAVSAKQFFVAAIISFALDMIVAIATQGSRPSTQAEAIIPGLIMGVLGWVAIICVIAGIVKWLASRNR